MASTLPPLQTASVKESVNDDSGLDKVNEFPCQQCGAKLTYQPGSKAMHCQYCHFENTVLQREEEIQELDFETYLKKALAKVDTEEKLFIKCNSCGAESSSEANVTSQNCPFCDCEIVSTAKSKKLIKPRSLLPFKVTKTVAKQSYQKWLKGLWFAPNSLMRRAKQDVPVSGVYVPHWTYYAATSTAYTGQHGRYYYVNETRSRKNAKGETETYTQRVRHTAWTDVSGRVLDDFNDVLVLASQSLPQKYMQALEPWDLKHLVPYQDDYLSGFKSESYQVSLSEGFERAKELMAQDIRASIRRDIGGDTQRIDSLRTQHSEITFKHILLPVWLSAYQYKNKSYRFLVNARTGEVQGERPWSWLKIGLALVTVIAIIAMITVYTQAQG